jgi:hypothetical protein
MNASQPEAGTEYSTAVGGPGPPDRRATRAREAPPGRARTLVTGLALAGAALLLAAELSPLLHLRTVARHERLVRTVATGPHHGWALVPIALLAALLALGARRAGGRAPHLLVAALGLAALGIALLADLPAVHDTGLVGSPATGLHDAAAHAAAGLYLETLGAIALLVAGVAGALLAPAPRGKRGRVRDSRA